MLDVQKGPNAQGCFTGTALCKAACLHHVISCQWTWIKTLICIIDHLQLRLRYLCGSLHLEHGEDGVGQAVCICVTQGCVFTISGSNVARNLPKAG